MYAIYQSGYSIVGIGTTLEAAQTHARAFLDDPDTVFDTMVVCSLWSGAGEVAGTFYARPCTQRLAEEVCAHGGDCLYDTNDGGYLDLRDA